MTLKLQRRTVLKAGGATLLATSAFPSFATAQKRGGTLRLGLSGGNSTDSWDGRTHLGRLHAGIRPWAARSIA